MGAHTELLESCDWDEEECNSVIEKATAVFNNLKLPDIPCDYRFFIDNVVRDALLKESIAKQHVSLIIRIVDQNAAYVAKILSLPEN
jgi:hypothetical protein